MANADRPSGLSPIGYLNSAPWTGGGRLYCIPQADAVAYAIGDPMQFAGSADANGIPTVAVATAGTGNAVLGPIVSGAGAPNDGGLYGVPADAPIVIPATKTRNYYVLIADDPNTIFEIQEVSGGTPLTAAEVGLNANLVAGTNNGYVSGWEVNNSGEAVTATLQLRLLGLARRPDNAFGEHAKWLVIINNHSYRIGQVGI
ncbi:MAG: hypothetical protein WA045_11085 [Nitrospira sp.]